MEVDAIHNNSDITWQPRTAEPAEPQKKLTTLQNDPQSLQKTKLFTKQQPFLRISIKYNKFHIQRSKIQKRLNFEA